MEPKTIILIITVFISLVFVVAYILMRRQYNEQTGSMWNTIHKLHEENSSLLDLYLEYKGKCKQQSKRIAELIELCDKLQPDLVEQHDENINRRFKSYDNEKAKEWGQRFENAKKLYKATTGIDLELYNSQKQK